MEANLFLVLGVLSVGLTAAAPPDGLYTTEGVTYTGCFDHGQAHHEEVLSLQINVDCTSAHPKTCLTPPTCLHSCRETDTSYIYIGMKFPGLCFCDSYLRGVNQSDSVDGLMHCDGTCAKDKTLACGNSFNMLVYHVDVSGIIPQMTTHVGTPIANSVGYTTEAGKDETTPKRANKRPQSNTVAIIAGASAGGTVVLIAGTVVGVCLWRKRSGRRRDDKPSSSLSLQDVIPHTHPPSAPYSNPAAAPNASNIDALYAKPDKKRKPMTSSPDDPSYQDVIPTGAHHQYATVNDNHPPSSIAQQDANPYDSIQNDPQYAVVNKRPKHRPNVDVNPIYMSGDDEANVSSGTSEMIDNIIYE